MCIRDRELEREAVHELQADQLRRSTQEALDHEKDTELARLRGVCEAQRVQLEALQRNEHERDPKEEDVLQLRAQLRAQHGMMHEIVHLLHASQASALSGSASNSRLGLTSLELLSATRSEAGVASDELRSVELEATQKLEELGREFRENCTSARVSLLVRLNSLGVAKVREHAGRMCEELDSSQTSATAALIRRFEQLEQALSGLRSNTSCQQEVGTALHTAEFAINEQATIRTTTIQAHLYNFQRQIEVLKQQLSATQLARKMSNEHLLQRSFGALHLLREQVAHSARSRVDSAARIVDQFQHLLHLASVLIRRHHSVKRTSANTASMIYQFTQSLGPGMHRSHRF
eukprot:TRINITY_DN10766_c0_g1_i4.p1 TRINITY_DN10766_c0_g1~~TRINITY_DN10766_c0_g1_i4.p1  ORF type:complete len:348 (-),score=67.39 TRINITY_DN10766_c0_g1_i4:243-1286(-)